MPACEPLCLRGSGALRVTARTFSSASTKRCDEMWKAVLRPRALAPARNSPAPSVLTRLAEVPIADLHKLGAEALKARATPRTRAVLLDVMLWPQLQGRAAGGLAAIAAGTLAPPSRLARPPTPARSSTRPSSIDRRLLPGMLVMHEGIDMAVQKAKQHGVGLVGTRNLGSPIGAIGYYLETIAHAGFVGLVFAQTPAAPAIGSAPSGGASPLGVSVPSSRGPIVLDMATAAATVLGMKGSTSPETGGLSDALAVFDRSYKGSHLSVMVELLAGPLVGGGAGADEYGNLILAFDPELLGDRDGFQRDVEAVLKRVKGEGMPATPGEASHAQLNSALTQGRVHVEDSLIEALRKVASGPAVSPASPTATAPIDKSGMALATRLAHPKGKGKGDPYNASSPVLYQTATFELDNQTLSGDYDYTRSVTLRAICRGADGDREATRAFAFTPAKGAWRSLWAVPAGGHTYGDDIYGGTSRLPARGARQRCDRYEWT